MISFDVTLPRMIHGSPNTFMWIAGTEFSWWTFGFAFIVGIIVGLSGEIDW